MATLPATESDQAALAGLADEEAARAAADEGLAADVADVAAIAAAALPQAGGTLTGPLVLDGDPVGNLEAATRQFVAGQIAALIAGAPGTLDTLKEIADRLATDESAVEALTATVAGKLGAAANLADLVDAVAARGNLGLGTAAVQPVGAFDPAGAAAAAQAASQPLDGDLTDIAAIATAPFGRALLGLANAAALRASAEAAAAVHAAAHQVGGADPLALPQYDLLDSLPGVFPLGFWPTTSTTLTVKRATLLRFTVARKRTFRFVRFPIITIGTGEDKVDCGIYLANGAKLERLGSSGNVKITTNALGVKVVELTGNVVCEPGNVYYVTLSPETVTGAPQVAAMNNNNGNYGDIFGTGTLANRIMIFKNEANPLPPTIEAPGGSTVLPWLVPSEV